MDEYIINVTIGGHPEEIKSYGKSVHHIVDTIINMSAVTDIITISRIRDKKTWSLKKEFDLEIMRKLRNEIQNESVITEALDKCK